MEKGGLGGTWGLVSIILSYIFSGNDRCGYLAKNEISAVCKERKMSCQQKCLNAQKNKNDIFYTPPYVAKKMIEMCGISPEMKVLDPCYGGGVFYENLPECKKEWCEIEKGKDFFEETERYDCIVGNPPYSKWNAWMDKTMELTDKFCYIMGALNITSPRFRRIFEKGYGVTQLHCITVDWYFGTSWLVLFEKNKPTIFTVEDKIIYCEVCNTRCGRGLRGNSVNDCHYVEKPPKPVKEKKPRKKSSPIVNVESEEIPK